MTSVVIVQFIVLLRWKLVLKVLAMLCISGAQQIMISERAQREEALLEKQKQAVEQADAAVGNKPAPVRRKDRRRVKGLIVAWSNDLTCLSQSYVEILRLGRPHG